MATKKTMTDDYLKKSFGMDPKTGLPIKILNEVDLKASIRNLLENEHITQCLNRYTWSGLPGDLTGDLIERILFYRGQGMFYYSKYSNKFYFLPYTLHAKDGTGIDEYGRYVSVESLRFNGGSPDGKDKNTGIVRDVLYTMPLYPAPQSEEETAAVIGQMLADQERYCVLLSDSSKRYTAVTEPKCTQYGGILDVMSDLIPFARTALMNSTGIKGMRVSGDPEALNVSNANQLVKYAALNGKTWVPITGSVTLEELTNGTSIKAEDFMIALQEIDNKRLQTLGLETAGLYNKKTVVTDSQMMMNASPAQLVYQDGLKQRQNFCDQVNALFGLGINCMPNESMMGMDMNGDGQFDREYREYNEGGADNANNDEDIQ